MGRGIVFGIVALAITVRGYAAWTDEIIFNDGPLFLETVQQILDGNLGAALSGIFHPLTAILIAGLHWVSGWELEICGKVLSVASGGLATAALFALARAQFGQATAVLAAVLFAVHPRMVAIASNVQSDGIHLAFVICGAWLSWRALETGRFLTGVMIGIVCGLAYLTRPEGLVIGVVLGLWLLADWYSGRIEARHFWRVVGGLVVTVMLFGGPYIWKISQQDDGWTLTRKKELVPAELTLPTLDRVGAAFSEVQKDGRRAATTAFLLLALLAWRPGWPSRRTRFFLSYLGVFFVVLMAVQLESGYVSRRHWLVPAALMIPFSAVGLQRVAKKCSELARMPRLAPVLMVMMLLGFLIESVPENEPKKLARRDAALWLRRLHPERVAGRRLRDAYYAGAAEHLQLNGEETADTLAIRMNGAGIRYAIVDDEYIDPREAPMLYVIHRIEHEGGAVLVLELQSDGDGP